MQLRLLRMQSEVKENIVASVVDVASILVAYNLGVHHLDPWVGLGYAGTDAWLVIWQRKRVTRWLHALGERLHLVQPRASVLRLGRFVWDIQAAAPRL